MKKICKILLVTIVTILMIEILKIMNINLEALPFSNVSRHVQAYNHNPSNIIDNVYKDDNYGLILPFIFSKNGETIQKDFVISQFSKKGLTPVFSKDVIGTGTTINVKETNTKYTIIVFGDTNGDGKVNLIDAQKIVLHNKDNTKSLTGVYFIAGNVSNNDKVINLIDAQRVVMLQKGLTNKLVVNEPKSIKETDSIAPTVVLTKNIVTTNSIKVTASAKDDQSGMPEKPIYTFYLKKSTENDNAYIKKQSGTNSIFEISNLIQNTNYTIKVETVDNLGNIGSKTLTLKTETVTPATNGAIVFGNIMWDSTTHKANVQITTNTKYKIKYQKNSINGNWLEGSLVTNLSLNDTLYACLSDGNNIGQYISLKIQDPVAPIISLKGNSEITLIVKDKYVEPGVIATDNVDGDITKNIKVSVKNEQNINLNDLDTNIPGIYTITYSIIDTAGNKSEITRKVIVNDIIDNIEISKLPNKTIYNYGEDIELVGAEIKINYLSGKSIDNIEIKNDMISGYDSKLEGKQEILVKYDEKETSFVVTVLKKIKGLELIETGRTNVTIEEDSDVYKTISKEQFVLGTIKELEEMDGSKLINTQVQFILKQQNTSLDSDITNFEETDKITLTINENNELVGHILEVGNYQIEAYIMYETEKIGITISLNAVKSPIAKDIILEAIEDDEVRYNNVKPVQKQLKIKNIHDEYIGILAQDLIITNNNLDKIEIVKLNEYKSPISLENETNTEVAYLEILTTSKLAIEDVSFKIEIKNTDIVQEIVFDIGETLGLTSIKVNKIQIDEDAETEVEADSVILGNTLGETILPVYFYNQLNEQMQVKAKDIEIVSNQWLENNSRNDEKLYITIPDVEIEKIINGNPIRTQGTGIIIELYNINGNIAQANDNVAKIGISLLNNQEQNIILSSLLDKYIKFIAEGLNQPYQLSIEIDYNEVTKLNFSDVNKENIEISNNDLCDYIAIQGNDFVLGTISAPVNEELKANMLEKSLIGTSSNTAGIDIYFEDAIDGTVLIKGTANQIGAYQIDIYLKDNLNINIDSIYINIEEAVNTEILDIEINQNYVIANDETITTINAISQNSTVEIKRKDIKIKEYNSNDIITNKLIIIEEPEDVEIELLDIYGIPIPEEGYDDIVISKIAIKYLGTVTQNMSKTINILLNNDQTPITKILYIYTSDIKVIDISSTVTLYNTSNNETVQNDGLNYSLMKIDGYLDNEKQIKTILKLSDFGENGEITVVPDKVLGKVNANMPIEIELDLLSVQYFDSNKNIISSLETNKEVSYIGFAIKPYVFNEENLTNAKITINYTTMQTPISININYIQN